MRHNMREKNNRFLPMQNQRRRSAVQVLTLQNMNAYVVQVFIPVMFYVCYNS